MSKNSVLNPTRRDVVGEQDGVGGLSHAAFHAWECDDHNASFDKTRRGDPPAQWTDSCPPDFENDKK